MSALYTTANMFRDSIGWSLVYYIDEQRYLRARHICCGDPPIWELTKTKVKPLHWYNKIGT